MSSLLDLLTTRYLETLRSVNSRWKILILDEHTRKMLDSVIKTYAVLQEGIQQIDLITSPRSPQTRLPALYLVMPTSKNVDYILQDFSINALNPVNGKSKKSSKSDPHAAEDVPKYAAAHVHFVDGIPDALAGRLTAGLPNHYLQALTELYTNFHALEPRAFSLKSPQSFFRLYAPPDSSPKESVQIWEEEIAFMSKSIVNALATLGEYPLIRYYDPPSSFHQPLGPAITTGQHIGKRLALAVQDQIDSYARDNADFPPIPDPPRPRGILFITDRSMDLFAPLLHEFTYQAMCNDLLRVENGTNYKYTFKNAQGGTEEKEVLLNDDDSVWKEVRHMHMKDALDKLILDFKNYAGEHGQKFGGEGAASLNDMKDMLASLPQLKEVKDKLSLHLTMAEKCMELFETKKLPLSASVEQCCATGLTPEGKSPKTLVEEMVPLLDDRGVSSTDKLRIIALYIMHRDGVPEGDKKRLYQHARLALHEMDAVDNLSYLGINVSKDSGKKRKALFKHRDQEDAYDISRYQPAIKYMLEDHFANRLDQSMFPYVRDAPVDATSSSRSTAIPTQGSLRSAKPVWTTRGAGRKAVNEPRQRVIVFVAGGTTYSEIRTAYKVSESSNKDIYIGSTHVTTPNQFVEALGSLDRGGNSSAPHNSATHYTAAPKQKSSSKSAPPLETQSSEVSQSSFDKRFSPPFSASSSMHNNQPAAPPLSSGAAFRSRLSKSKAPQERQEAPPRQEISRSNDQLSQDYGSSRQSQQPPRDYQERDRYRDSSPSNSYNNEPSYRNEPESRHSYRAPPPQQERYEQRPPPSNGYFQSGPPPRDNYNENRYSERAESSNGSGRIPTASSTNSGSSSQADTSVSKKKSFLSRFK